MGVLHSKWLEQPGPQEFVERKAGDHLHQSPQNIVGQSVRKGISRFVHQWQLAKCRHQLLNGASFSESPSATPAAPYSSDNRRCLALGASSPRNR